MSRLVLLGRRGVVISLYDPDSTLIISTATKSDSISVARIDDPVVAININQQHHHGENSFKEEFLEFLDKYEIEYDEKYLWD